MRYQPAIQTSAPEQLDGLQPGQWINYEGAMGRYMGQVNGVSWIAWGTTARRRFRYFASAYRNWKS